MSNHAMSPAFVDDVARFGGSASQVAWLRSQSRTGGSGGPKALQPDHIPPPPTGRFRTWDRFLLWLAGVNYELASRSYVDRTRHATIGFAVLVTALIAGVSFFLVLSSSGVNAPLSVLASTAWMALILTLQRSLVASATRRFDSLRKAALVTGVSLLVALLLSIIVAQPLMLRLFQSEIEQQIQTSRLHETQAFYSDQINSPVVLDLRNEVDESKARADSALQRYLCEVDGSCGTGSPGIGLEAQQLKLDADRAQLDYMNARSQYEAATREIQQSVTQLNARPVGLLDQFRAFNAVSSNEPMVQVASYLTTGLFVMIEMLPLLLVTLSRRRGTTLYEKLLAIEERYAQEAYELDAIRKASARRLRDDTDEKVDHVLRQLEEQFDEMGQATRATASTVIQLAEERDKRRAG